MRLRIFAISTLLILSVLPIRAQSPETAPIIEDTALAPIKKAKKERPPFVPQHDLRFQMGLLPMYLIFHFYDGHQSVYYSDRVRESAFSYTLAYGYRFKKWLDVEGALSYDYTYYRIKSRQNSMYLRRYTQSFVTVMPIVRFTYLNSTHVRLYSKIGLGVMATTGEYDDITGKNNPLVLPAAQLSLFGIAVGKSLFAFAELGIGGQGVVLFGVGYRFNDKNAK